MFYFSINTHVLLNSLQINTGYIYIFCYLCYTAKRLISNFSAMPKQLDAEAWKGYTPVRDPIKNNIIAALCHSCNTEKRKMLKSYMINHRSVLIYMLQL